MCYVVKNPISCTYDGFPGVGADWPGQDTEVVLKKQWDNLTGIRAALDEINIYLLDCLANHSAVLHANDSSFTPYKNELYYPDSVNAITNSYTNTAFRTTVTDCAAVISNTYTRSGYTSATDCSYNNTSYTSTARSSYNPDPSCSSYTASSRTTNGCSVYSSDATCSITQTGNATVRSSYNASV